ncbi:MAG: acetylglutamate kinase [Candidatus Carbobacillus sp.]|nr:acetylglutamate kinase [Candidatus Carbobacillus sp.]
MASPKCPWIIKLGGSMIDRLDQKWFDRFRVISDGSPLIFVHGGGKAIDALLLSLGHTPQYHRGLRITDKTTLAVVQMVLNGTVNSTIVRMMQNAGFQAVGISGMDGGLIQAQQTVDETLGYVGHVVSIQRALLDTLLDHGYVPIVSPISLGLDGMPLNINADEVATALATVYGARLWLFSDVPGIYITEASTGQRRIVPALDAKSAQDMIASGMITGGMIPKVEKSLEALLQGVPEIFILRGDDVEDLEKYIRGEVVGTRLVSASASSEVVGRT